MNRFIHIRSYSSFCNLKLSADIDNTSYTIGPSDIIEFGTPDVRFDSIVFVSEKSMMWTHGKIYECNKDGSAVQFGSALPAASADYAGKLFNQTSDGKLYICTKTSENQYVWTEYLSLFNAVLLNESNVGNLNLTGNLTVSGNISQHGEAYITEAEKVESKDDYIVMRHGNTSALAAGDYSGFEVENYDGSGNKLRLVVDNKGVARVGDVGDEQPIATRSESANLHTGGIMTWNSETQSMDERVGNLRPIILPNLNYNEVGSTTATEDFLEKLLKYIVSNYNSGANTEKLFITASTPNSRGITIIHMYSSANYNSTGLPQYCSGIFNELSSNGGIIRFGTLEGQFWIDIPTRIWKGSTSQLPSSLASNSLYFII